jgi:hypothetical protein
MNATMVATAEEAIEILENTAVDIVLTDLLLPHTSGLELLKRVHDYASESAGDRADAIWNDRFGGGGYAHGGDRLPKLLSLLPSAIGANDLSQSSLNNRPFQWCGTPARLTQTSAVTPCVRCFPHERNFCSPRHA